MPSRIIGNTRGIPDGHLVTAIHSEIRHPEILNNYPILKLIVMSWFWWRGPRVIIKDMAIRLHVKTSINVIIAYLYQSLSITKCMFQMLEGMTLSSQLKHSIASVLAATLVCWSLIFLNALFSLWFWPFVFVFVFRVNCYVVMKTWK